MLCENFLKGSQGVVIFRKKADVVKAKNSSVKQKVMKRDGNLEDFTAIPAVKDEEGEDFLRFDEMHLSRPLLKGISVRNPLALLSLNTSQNLK